MNPKIPLAIDISSQTHFCRKWIQFSQNISQYVLTSCRRPVEGLAICPQRSHTIQISVRWIRTKSKTHKTIVKYSKCIIDDCSYVKWLLFKIR